jgi:hypothetical protein
MGAFDLNKVAIAMGKILKQMPELERKSQSWFSIDENKEDFYVMAYVARISILDVMEQNSYMRNGTLPITIPLGIFKTRKETLENALNITVGHLLELTEGHDQVHHIINDILERGHCFYEFEKMVPPEVRRKLM